MKKRLLTALILFILLLVVAFFVWNQFSTQENPPNETSPPETIELPQTPPAEGALLPVEEPPTTGPTPPSTEPIPAPNKTKKPNPASPTAKEALPEGWNEIGEELADDPPSAQPKAQAIKEEDSGEISGIWEGTIQLTEGGSYPVVLNRIWDQLTNEYLPSACVAFQVGPSQNVASTVRNKNLNFREKDTKPRKTIAIEIKNTYSLELKAPRPNQTETIGTLLKRKGDRFVPLGSVSIEKRIEETADFDCESVF